MGRAAQGPELGPRVWARLPDDSDIQTGPGLGRSGERKGVFVGENNMRKGSGARGDLGLLEKQKKGRGLGGREQWGGDSERGGTSSQGV